MRRELTHGSLFSGIEGFGLGANDMGVSEEEFNSYEYRNAGTLEEPVLFPA